MDVQNQYEYIYETLFDFIYYIFKMTVNIYDIAQTTLDFLVCLTLTWANDFVRIYFTLLYLHKLDLDMFSFNNNKPCISFE